MNIQKKLNAFLFLIIFSGIVNAHVSLDLEPGWPRLVDNETTIKNKFRGNTAFFEAESKFVQQNTAFNARDVRSGNRPRGLDPYFKEDSGSSREYIRRPSFYTWANIRVGEDHELEVLDGLFEVYGAIEREGEIYRGLALSVSLLDIEWDGYTLLFKTETDQSGYLCDLGYCSFDNESLFFNITSGIFDGYFDENFRMTAQTIASLGDTLSPDVVHMPVPAAFWLFGSALLGMRQFKKSQAATNRLIAV